MVDITSNNLNIRLTAAENITAYLCGGNLQVIFGKNAEINMSSAVTYIQSGKAEITEAVADCIEAYNINANSKTADFNDNAELKVADFDDNAAKAIAEAQNWAHQAEASAFSMAKRDLSNLTALGEAKFSAKQDVILDLVTIRNGAALGSTALQSITSSDVTTALGYTPYNASNPSGYITSSALSPYALSADLASVATSGSYNDLSDKPNLAAKADVDLSNINPTSAKKAEITSWGMPDYTSGVSKSANVNYTADSNGFIIAAPTVQSGASRLKIKIDGTEFMFFQGYSGTDYEHLNIGCIPIAKNSTYSITLLSNCNVRFFPCIGG